MASRGRRARYAGDLRQDLLDAAVLALAEDDPAALSLRALARGLGVSHAAPKNHFPDKTALFVAVAIDGFQQLEQALRAAREPVDDPVAAFLAAGEAYVGFALDHPGHFRVMWRNDLLGEDTEAVDAAGEGAFRALVEAVCEGRDAGWAAGQDPMDVALAAWGLVHGLAQLALDGPLGEMDPRGPRGVAAASLTLLFPTLQ